MVELRNYKFQIALSSNSMVKATQMWVDAAKDEEGSKGDSTSLGPSESPPATEEKFFGSAETLSCSGPMKLIPLAGGARTPSGSAVAAFKPLTPVFTPTGSFSGRRKRPAALGASGASPASLSSGASPALSSVGTYSISWSILYIHFGIHFAVERHSFTISPSFQCYISSLAGSAKRPRLKFKAPTRVTPVADVSSSQKENERLTQNVDFESNQFESDICDFMDKMEEAEQKSVES